MIWTSAGIEWGLVLTLCAEHIRSFRHRMEMNICTGREGGRCRRVMVLLVLLVLL